MTITYTLLAEEVCTVVTFRNTSTVHNMYYGLTDICFLGRHACAETQVNEAIAPGQSRSLHVSFHAKPCHVKTGNDLAVAMVTGIPVPPRVPLEATVYVPLRCRFLGWHYDVVRDVRGPEPVEMLELGGVVEVTAGTQSDYCIHACATQIPPRE
jgi:hypothetical protein